MQQPYDFDTDVYFSYVAENLLKNLGLRALHYADEALQKMKALDDHEGFEIWLAIQKALTERATENMRPAGSALH